MMTSVQVGDYVVYANNLAKVGEVGKERVSIHSVTKLACWRCDLDNVIKPGQTLNRSTFLHTWASALEAEIDPTTIFERYNINRREWHEVMHSDLVEELIGNETMIRIAKQKRTVTIMGRELPMPVTEFGKNVCSGTVLGAVACFETDEDRKAWLNLFIDMLNGTLTDDS